MAKKKSIKRLPRQLMSRKIFSLIFDDFSFFGSLPFFLFITLSALFIGNIELFYRLAYFLLISIIVIIAIKTIHYKDRPQKEEFDIFMEKMVASSFPSSHSLTITALTIFLSLAYPYIWVVTMFSIISLMVYIQRYVTKKHFFVDIVGGILTAIVIAIFVIKVF